MEEFERGKPLVSVIIPFYNRLHWVAEAVQSVRAQTRPTGEIILVDDGSVEDVRAWLNLEADDLRYIHQANKGPAAARNRGIDAAQGEFLAFLDSDDLFLPEKLARQLAAMLDHPDVLMSHTSYVRIDGVGNLMEVIHSGQYGGRVFPEILLGCMIATPTVMIRRAALGDHLRFNEAVHIGEDILLWSQLARRSAILGIDEPLSKVRLHGRNVAFDHAAQIQGLYNLLNYGIRVSPDLSVAQRRKLSSVHYRKIADHYYHNRQKLRAFACVAQAAMNDPADHAWRIARCLRTWLRRIRAVLTNSARRAYARLRALGLSRLPQSVYCTLRFVWRKLRRQSRLP